MNTGLWLWSPAVGRSPLSGCLLWPAGGWGHWISGDELGGRVGTPGMGRSGPKVCPSTHMCEH